MTSCVSFIIDLLESAAVFQVTSEDNGTYVLRVNSSLFGEHDIKFNIKVVKSISSSNIAAIVGGFLASLLALTWIAIATVWRLKKQRNKRYSSGKFLLNFFDILKQLGVIELQCI